MTQATRLLISSTRALGGGKETGSIILDTRFCSRSTSQNVGMRPQLSARYGPPGSPGGGSDAFGFEPVLSCFSAVLPCFLCLKCSLLPLLSFLSVCFEYLFIWLHQVSVVAHGGLCGVTWHLWFQYRDSLVVAQILNCSMARRVLVP